MQSVARGDMIVVRRGIWSSGAMHGFQAFSYSLPARRGNGAASESCTILKALVYIILLVDVIQTGFGIHEAWWYAIQNWGNVPSLQHGPWTALMAPITCGIVAALVQIFYAWQIWRWSDKLLPRLTAALIVLLALLQTLAAVVADLLLWQNLSQSNLLQLHPVFEVFLYDLIDVWHHLNLPQIWLSVSFITDILIATSMILMLQGSKTHSNLTRIDNIIDRLIINSIRTGAITVICAGVTLALFIQYTDKNYFHAFVAILGKLYSNSFMLNLNSRHSKNRHQEHQSIPLELQRPNGAISSIHFTSPDPMEVSVQKPDGDEMESNTEELK
uniref:DUF6534 domain-containing protein n=1 Tax=Mycena chlorophos TaxID=658473 RepID=A0ABQ0L7N1_MYCCL|nr:predicted protein [Mycena chlorophos]